MVLAVGLMLLASMPGAQAPAPRSSEPSITASTLGSAQASAVPSAPPEHFWQRSVPTNVPVSNNWHLAAAGEPEFTINRWGAMSATWEDQATVGCPLGPVGLSESNDSGASFGSSTVIGPFYGSDTSCANGQFEFDVAQTSNSPNGTMWFSYGAESGPGDNTYTTMLWNNGTHVSEPVISVPAATTGNNFLDRDWIMSTPNGTVVSVVDSCPGNTCANIYESTAWDGMHFNPVVQVYNNGDTTASADALNNAQWLVGDQATPSQPGVCQLITTNNSGASWQAAPSAPAGCGSMTWQMAWGQGPSVDIVFLNSAGTAALFSQTLNWGRTWSTPVTISGSPPSGTIFQTPTIAADPATGEIAIFWLDTRANPSTDQWNVYETDSPDNGATWSPVQQVSSAVVGTGSSFWSGDWIWSRLTPWGTAAVIWGDNRTNSRLLTEFAQMPYEAPSAGNLTVSVVDAALNPVANAYVSVGGSYGRTSSAGTVTFYNLAPGSVPCTAYKAGVGSGSATGSVTKGTTSSVQIRLGGGSSLTAGASANVTLGRSPLVVGFTGTASGGTAPYSYAWNFGDGASSLLQDPSHTYSAPGNYTAHLWVNDSASGSATAQVSIAVWNALQPVTVSLQALPTTATLGNAVAFTATPGGGTGTYTSYLWSSLPTGCPTPTAPSFSCTPTVVGHWNVSVVVADSGGRQGTARVQVNVYSGTPPALTLALVAVPRAFSLGTSTTLTATPSGGTPPYASYAWTGLPSGCASAVQASFSCVPAAAGHFNVTATVTDTAGVQASGTVELDVWSTPTSVGVTATAHPASLAVGSSTTLDAVAQGGSGTYPTYAWGALPPGCTAQNAASFSCAPSSPGHYNATVMVTDSQGHSGHAIVEIDVYSASSSQSPPTGSTSPLGLGAWGLPLLALAVLVVVVAVAAALVLRRRRRPRSPSPDTGPDPSAAGPPGPWAPSGPS